MAEGLIRGAFPFYNPEEAAEAASRPKAKADGSQYHRPQPPQEAPQGSGFRRSSIGPAPVLRTPELEAGSRKRPVVPRLPLAQIRQLQEGNNEGDSEDPDAAEPQSRSVARGRRGEAEADAAAQPISAGRVCLEDEASSTSTSKNNHQKQKQQQGDGSPPQSERARQQQQQQQQRSRTLGWAATKRQDAPSNSNSSAPGAKPILGGGTTTSAPRKEPGSDQWYIPGSSSRRNSSIHSSGGSGVAIVAGAGLPAPQAVGADDTRTRQPQQQEQRRRQLLAAQQPGVGSVVTRAESSPQRQPEASSSGAAAAVAAGGSGPLSARGSAGSSGASVLAAARGGAATAREMRQEQVDQDSEPLLREPPRSHRDEGTVGNGHRVARRLALFLHDTGNDTGNDPGGTPGHGSPPEGHRVSPGWAEKPPSETTSLIGNNTNQPNSDYLSSSSGFKDPGRQQLLLTPPEDSAMQQSSMTRRQQKKKQQSYQPLLSGQESSPRTPRGSPMRSAFVSSQRALDRELQHAKALLLTPSVHSDLSPPHQMMAAAASLNPGTGGDNIPDELHASVNHHDGSANISGRSSSSPARSTTPIRERYSGLMTSRRAPAGGKQ